MVKAVDDYDEVFLHVDNDGRMTVLDNELIKVTATYLTKPLTYEYGGMRVDGKHVIHIAKH